MKRELLFVIPLLFAAITSQAQSYNNLNNLINRDSLEKNLDNAIGRCYLSAQHTSSHHEKPPAVQFICLYHLHTESFLGYIQKIEPFQRPQLQSGHRIR